MTKIRILPEILSNKIAAGEVVERPASVVKELLENAIDADSTQIFIDVEQGGRSLIRVSDNGMGMSHDDALLALERYATSKIYKDEDLFSIHTLGFRGEALPSIAAVSRFSIVTRDRSEDAGTEILVDGGRIKKVSELGAPKGTMVTVRQLFFNTPARRKFLKTIGTEMGHIADIFASVALGHPELQFRLTHNGKTIKNWPVTAEPFDRVVDVLGGDLQNNLYPIDFKHDRVSISGWISSPHVTRRTSRGLYVYVNGRFVRDRIVQHALFEGYSQRLVKGQFPVAVVLINIPFYDVDVNVHPTKNEVRFAQQRRVHEAVRRAVAQTLYEVDRPRWAPVGFSGDARQSKPAQILDGGREEFGRSKAAGEKGNAEIAAWGSRSQIDPYPKSGIPHPVSGIQPPQSVIRRPLTEDYKIQTGIWKRKRFADMRVIGQFHNTYIVCETEDGLILLDQHAAHERILFEQLSARSAQTRSSAQRLLVPETIELGYREAGVLEKIIPNLGELGLDVEPFGGNTFVVKSVPALLSEREVKPLIVTIVETIVEIGTSAGLPELLDQCRMVMACHAALRAHQALSDKQINELLHQLDRCDNPSHCPHGRPTWIRWDLNTLEKSFKRIV